MKYNSTAKLGLVLPTLLELHFLQIASISFLFQLGSFIIFLIANNVYFMQVGQYNEIGFQANSKPNAYSRIFSNGIGS